MRWLSSFKKYPINKDRRIANNMTTTSDQKKVKSHIPHSKILSIDDLGPGIIESSYLIRGCVLHRAIELMGMKEKGQTLPFEKFYPLHYGNPQLLGQPPITFIREVIAGSFCPNLLDKGVFSADVAKRVKYYLDNIPNSAVGAYADAPGFPIIVKDVCDYISKRDGYPCLEENVYLTDGTLDGMMFVIKLMFSKQGSGMLLPMPEYPGYSFLATQAEGKVVTYSLNEDDNWSIEVLFFSKF